MKPPRGKPAFTLSPLTVNLERINLTPFKQPPEPATPKTSVAFSQELKKAINERNILSTRTRKRMFQALDEYKTQAAKESLQYKRESALLEIVNSEKKYVHQLETIQKFFMKPIKDRDLLSDEVYNTLFGHIKTIYNVNKKLLEELDSGVEHVSSAFLNVSPCLKLYSMYAYNFKEAIKILQNSTDYNLAFAKFLEAQESRPEVQSKLSALLITPIQRVPRYKLLLKQLIDLTPSGTLEHKTLTDCLDIISDVAEHINKIVEEHENAQTLLEFQRCLKNNQPNIIVPGRKLLKQGVLNQMNEKGSSSPIYTTLMNDILMFCKMKKGEAKINSLKCFSIFPLSKCTVIDLISKEGYFQIQCEKDEVRLYHEKAAEMKQWIQGVKKALISYNSNRMTLKKENSSRRPVKRKDIHEYHNVGLSPGRPLKKKKRALEEDFTEQEPRLEQDNRFDNEESSPVSNELFVFGREQEERPFRFSLLNVMGAVGSSIKRIFGFRA